MTNYMPFSALVSFLGLLLLPMVVPLAATRDWRIFTVTMTLVYFIFSAVVYDPSSLFDLAFYRRDGNFFVTFGGLLLLLVFGGPSNAETWATALLLATAAIYGVFFAIWLATGLTPREDWTFVPYSQFNPLFYSNNAAGGFLAVLSAVGLGLAWARRSVPLLCASVLLILFCVFSASRGSLLGLFCGLVIFAITERAGIVLVPSLLVATFSILSLLIGLAMAFLSEFDISQTESYLRFLLYLDDGFVDEKTANVLIRTHFLFPLAASLGLQSPLFGLGFGSFDDRPYNIVQIVPYLIAVNRPAEILHTDSHAHNTFLHVFAELGLFGLCATTFFFAALINLTRDIRERGLRFGLQIAFWTLITSSITEHRAFTPSNALPFVLLLGLALGGRFAARFAWSALSGGAIGGQSADQRAR